MKRAFPALAFLAVAAIPVLVILIPLGTFLISSFHVVPDGGADPHFSLANYQRIFREDVYIPVLLNSLWLCIRVALLCGLIGYPIAWFIWRRSGRVRAALLLLLVIPMFMSYIVKLYTMRSLLGLRGLVNEFLVWAGILDAPSNAFIYNQTAVLLTLTVILLPFFILPVFLALDRIPRSLVHASADLGGSPWVNFRTVVLPLSAPGAMAGILFTFVLALGDFVTSQMVGGVEGITYGQIVWAQFGLAFNWPLGAALGALLFLVCGVVIFAGGLLFRRSQTL